MPDPEASAVAKQVHTSAVKSTTKGHRGVDCARVADPVATDRHSPPAPADRMLYGRRRGHRLRARQSELISAMLPDLRIAEDGPELLDPRSLFGFAPRAVWLEIGFGSAEHLIWQAERNPDIGFIGAEPFVNGIAKLLVAIEDRRLTNIRIHDDDARSLLARLAPASLDRVFVLFPDPWPKARHHKRRIINPQTVSELARAIRSGGTIRVASDVASYQCWILKHMVHGNVFEWLAESADDWRRRPADWPATRYEEKAIAAGRKPAFLTYRRA